MDMKSYEGALIGAYIGVITILQALRLGTFRWFIALTDLLGAVLAGYFTWISGNEAGLDTSLNMILTIIVSANIFKVIAGIRSQEFFNFIINNYIKGRDK